MAVPDISSHAAYPPKTNPLDNDSAGAILTQAQPPVLPSLFGGDNNVHLTPEQKNVSVWS